MPSTLAFDVFWNWLTAHHGCILSAGTPEAVIYDDDDLHWAFGVEDDGALIVQVLHGKRVVGELFLDSEQVAYVEWGAGERDGEFAFDLISESESDRLSAYHFVLAHGYEEHEPRGGRVH
jgi:hypothetical protein